MSTIESREPSVRRIVSKLTSTYTAPIALTTAITLAHIFRPNSIAKESLLADILVLHPEMSLQPAMIGSMFVHVGPAHLATNIVLIGFTMTYIAKRTNQLYSTLVAFGSHLFGAGGVMILGEVFKLGNVGGASIAGYGLLGVAALLFAKEQQYSYPWTLSFPAVIGVAELTRITLTIPTLTYAGRVTPTSHVAHTAGIVAGVVLFFTIYTPDN